MPGAPEGHLSNENRWLRSIRALWIISDKTDFDEPRRLHERERRLDGQQSDESQSDGVGVATGGDGCCGERDLRWKRAEGRSEREHERERDLDGATAWHMTSSLG